MISILIPTYTVDCLRLVADVQKQCEELQAQYGESEFDYEILVADDASPVESIVERNEMIELLPNCTHLRIIEEYHHGRIYVLRSAPGEGTVFRIELPINSQ